MKEAPPPLSQAEAELENVRFSENNAVDNRVNTLGSVSLPISPEAKRAISSLTAGTVNYVQLSIDIKGEVVNLGESATVKVSALAKKLPEDQASYILFTFSHTYEGDNYHSLVFIYSMPAGVASIRERMMYSSCKAAVVDLIQTELQLNIAKKLEIGDREDLTEQFLIDEIHPKQLVYRPKFDKPKGPANRGQKRIARVNQ
nr:twinfilin [Parasacculina yatsui]